MMCSKTKCKKCGMWWEVSHNFPDGRSEASYACGLMAIHSELSKINESTQSVVKCAQAGATQAIQAIYDMIKGRVLK